jgi:hypothetical protein
MSPRTARAAMNADIGTATVTWVAPPIPRKALIEKANKPRAPT